MIVTHTDDLSGKLECKVPPIETTAEADFRHRIWPSIGTQRMP